MLRLPFLKQRLMKVYVLNYSSGQWDSYDSWIAGVFSEESKAREIGIAKDAKCRAIRENEPHPDKVSEKDFDDYYAKHEQELDYNGHTITECELDQIITP